MSRLVETCRRLADEREVRLASLARAAAVGRDRLAGRLGAAPHAGDGMGDDRRAPLARAPSRERRRVRPLGRTRRRPAEPGAVASNRRGASRTRAAVIPLPARRGSGRVGALLPSGRSVAVGLGLLALAAGAYALARSTSVFAVEAVRVEGTTPAVARQVRAVLERDLGTSSRSTVTWWPGSRRCRSGARRTTERSPTLVVRIERELPAAVLRRGTSPGSSRSAAACSARSRGSAPAPPPSLGRRRAAARGRGAPPAADGRAVDGRRAGLPRDFPVAVRSVAIRDGAALLVLAGGLEVGSARRATRSSSR